MYVHLGKRKGVTIKLYFQKKSRGTTINANGNNSVILLRNILSKRRIQVIPRYKEYSSIIFQTTLHYNQVFNF